MNRARRRGALLALDAGVRETGWAIFPPGPEFITGVITGVIGLPGRRGTKAQARVTHLIEALDALVAQWRPEMVAHSQPSRIHWPVPALELLDTALLEWSARHRLRLHAYTAQEVRTAVAGHPNASREELAYAVMAGLGLIGRAKTTHEWEAVAVGQHHLSWQPAGWVCPPPPAATPQPKRARPASGP